MAKRIFTSFAIEDKPLRDFIVGQARNKKSPFEFIDMSVKKPWDTKWKTNCRKKIKGCNGLIVIVTKNTRKATGQLWEIKCAKEEGIPIRAIWGYSDKIKRPKYLPKELKSIRVVNWTWDNISNWIMKS